MTKKDEDGATLLLPRQERERFERYTKIYLDYKEMTKSDRTMSENKKHVALAAKYDVSITTIRVVIEKYSHDYPI